MCTGSFDSGRRPLERGLSRDLARSGGKTIRFRHARHNGFAAFLPVPADRRQAGIHTSAETVCMHVEGVIIGILPGFFLYSESE
jgi:hypothetical protein